MDCDSNNSMSWLSCYTYDDTNSARTWYHDLIAAYAIGHDFCRVGRAHCHVNATCINLDSQHVCQCNRGFIGNGYTCTGQLSRPNYEHYWHFNIWIIQAFVTSLQLWSTHIIGIVRPWLLLSPFYVTSIYTSCIIDIFRFRRLFNYETNYVIHILIFRQ